MWVGVDSALSQLLRLRAPESCSSQSNKREGRRLGGQCLEGGGERDRLIQDPRKDEPAKFKGRSTNFGIGGTKFWDILGV